MYSFQTIFPYFMKEAYVCLVQYKLETSFTHISFTLTILTLLLIFYLLFLNHYCLLSYPVIDLQIA